MSPNTEEVYKIFCIILDGYSPFSVKINKNENVHDLKVTIRTEMAPRFNLFAPVDLSLYQIDVDTINRNEQQAMDEVEAIFRTLSSADKLKTTLLNEVFLLGAPDDRILIIVEHPEGESRASGVIPMSLLYSSPADVSPTPICTLQPLYRGPAIIYR